MRCVLALLVLVTVGACSLAPAPGSVTSGPEADYQDALAVAKNKKYAEAIAAFRKIAAEAPETPMSADSLFEVAYLQAFYDNPHRDYAQALASFEEFLRRYPEHAKAPEAKNWRTVLKTLLEAKKENEHLRQDIEQLNELDIIHEEKRRK